MSVDRQTRGPAAAERDPRPIVAVPRRGIPPALIAAIALARGAAAVPAARGAAPAARKSRLRATSRRWSPYAPPPPLSIPSETCPPPQYVPVVAAPPVAVAPVARRRRPLRSRSASATSAARRRRRSSIANCRRRADRVAARAGRPATSASPALVIDTSAEIPIGTLIPAVLETPIDTSRPGLARAIVARDARGLDGQRVLVPRGSRLIGEYQSDVRSGQNRVLVNWTRLIRPDGASVRLGVPSADESGAAGIPGQYHSFFLKRFFNAALQTAMSVGGNLIGNSAGNTVIVGLPNSIGAAVGQAGQGLFSSDVRPKITIKPGTLFNVFVARELDLSGTSAAQ